MPRQKAPLPQAAVSDPEAHAVLVQAMADVGADPALVYAFQKTGVYVCEENEKRLPNQVGGIQRRRRRILLDHQPRCSLMAS